MGHHPIYRKSGGMNHIGNVIREFRIGSGMSRAEFARDICSEKYVYMIEKSQRTPSAEILNLFSNRLGVDLFEYYKYLGCENPIAVCKIMQKTLLYRKNGNYRLANELMDEAAELPDFQKAPWVYEFEINRISYMFYSQRNFTEVIPALIALIEKIEPRYSNEAYMAGIYALLSMAYQTIHDLAGAKDALAKASALIEGQIDSSRYADIIVSVRLSHIGLLYQLGDYQELIDRASELLEFQVSHSVFERAFYTFFYLAFASFHMDETSHAIEWFKKGIYSVLIRNYSADVLFIASQDVFDELLTASEFNTDIICELQDKYNI